MRCHKEVFSVQKKRGEKKHLEEAFAASKVYFNIKREREPVVHPRTEASVAAMQNTENAFGKKIFKYKKEAPEMSNFLIIMGMHNGFFGLFSLKVQHKENPLKLNKREKCIFNARLFVFTSCIN